MSLILSIGSNLGDRKKNLEACLFELCKKWELISKSDIFESKAVDYLDQPDFYNQALEFKIPKMNPEEALDFILSIEKKFGRTRKINKGPRILDIDIIFWDTLVLESDRLVIPHPAWFKRSFVVNPIKQLDYYPQLKKHFEFPDFFDNTATSIL